MDTGNLTSYLRPTGDVLPLSLSTRTWLPNPKVNRPYRGIFFAPTPQTLMLFLRLPSTPVHRGLTFSIFLHPLLIYPGLIFQIFLRRTRMGLAMQAVAQDRETASLMGVEAGSVYLRSFAIAAALAGLAGALMAPVYTVAPTMGELPMLKAFVVVILGGLGSVPGAVLGGLMIGLSESVFSTMFNTTLALIASFVIVLAVIIVKPTGLWTRGGR